MDDGYQITAEKGRPIQATAKDVLFRLYGNESLAYSTFACMLGEIESRNSVICG